MNTAPRYVVVTPVRDEVEHVVHTLESLVHQTLRPLRWVIVDDGSTDGTAAVLDRYAAQHAWIEVVYRTDRGYRAAGGGVVDAFYAGYPQVAHEPWEYLVKLDADLSFAPDYFARCLARFAADPSLGLAGGTVCRLERDALRVDAPGDPPFHVRGATKIYRRACWQAIAPLVRAPGWDTLDEVSALRHGWRTCTFDDVVLVQHKPTGSADGRWANAVKNGKANFVAGYHPLFMLAKCLRRAARRARLVEAAGLLCGFLSGYARHLRPLADRQTVRFLRREQMRCLLLRPSIYGQPGRQLAGALPGQARGRTRGQAGRG
ncbi:MAG: hypothetical protein RLZZ584_2203 [Pseudomonadota bacterium]|jgi:glycosyltransferase involved in cell wall biosynthesis